MDDLPKAEFAFPGPVRDQLVGAILTGEKVATTSLVVEYQRDGKPLPAVRERCVVVDSADQPVAVIETIEVRVVRLGDIDLAHATDEGEGYETVADWRAGHESFWHSPEYRGYVGDAEFTVNDDTLVVAQRFRVEPS